MRLKGVWMRMNWLALLVAGAVLLTSTTASAADRETASAIEIRQLDDPSNPYRGQYSEFDKWLFAQASTGNVMQEKQPAKYSPERVTVSLDQRDFLVPSASRIRGELPAAPTIRQAVEQDMFDSPANDEVVVTADPPAHLAKTWEMIRLAEDARIGRVVPAWLGNNPPLETVLVPNGDILTFGELGLQLEGGYEEKSDSPGENWYRYSAEGKLLGVYQLGYRGGWQSIYDADHVLRSDVQMGFFVTDQLIATYGEDAVKKQLSLRVPDGTFVIFSRYLVIARQNGTQEELQSGRRVMHAVRAYDYDGTEVDLDTPVTTDMTLSFSRTMLRGVYEAQVANGLVDPTSVSPYAGTELGPVVAEETPRPPRHLATRMELPFDSPPNRTPIVQKWVVIQSLDDPANPYRGQYDEWDLWRFEHLRQVSSKRQPVSVRTDYFDPMAEGSASTAYFDELGYLIPMRSRWVKQIALRNRDLRIPIIWELDDFSASSFGVMDAEVELDEARVRWDLFKNQYPEVPEWILSVPLKRMFFVPNGEIVTQEPADSYIPGEPGEPDGTPAQKPAWKRYSSTGEVIAEMEATDWNWEFMYFDGWPQLIQEAESKGWKAYFNNGFLIVSRESDHEVIAAYDYDGTPVDVSRPLRRPGIWCVCTFPHELDDIYRAQRAAKSLNP